MSIDTSANLFMKNIENPFFTIISKSIHVFFEPLVLIVISLLISAYLFYKKKKKEGIVFAASIAVMAVVLYLIKEIVDRVRPISSLIVETGSSFPSGHTLAAVVFFGLITYFLTRKKSSMNKVFYSVGILLILLTGFSRLYLSVHWFTDVLASFLLGGIILLAAIVILEKLK